jgi:antitoxin FitA
VTTIAIPVSDSGEAQLRALAQQTGLTPEEYLRRRIEQLLREPAQDFRASSEYALEKNAELYRRLA